MNQAAADSKILNHLKISHTYLVTGQIYWLDLFLYMRLKNKIFSSKIGKDYDYIENIKDGDKCYYELNYN